MTRKRSSSAVDPRNASAYLDEARGFRRTVEQMASSGTQHRNSVAVIAVHSAIAFCDAVTIRAIGQKAKGDHRLAADFLRSVVRLHTPDDEKAIAGLRYLTGIKDRVSYAGEPVTAADIRQMRRRLEQFGDWAEQKFTALKDSPPR